MKRFTPNIPMILYVMVLLFLTSLFSSCGPSRSPLPSVGLPPSSFPIGYTQRGIASWYGPGFHGRLTANGEYYNMYAYTAAHRYLPFNTLVKVVNLKNHKSVIVRINDRGPFVKNRIIDLSYAAARKIGMIPAGTAPVLLEVVGRAYGNSNQKREIFFVQIGAFSSKENALRSYFYIKRLGYRGSRIVRIRQENRYIWRVQAGEFFSLKEAEAALSLLAERFPQAFVIAR